MKRWLILAAALALAGFGVSYALSAGETTGTVTAAIPDQTVTIPGTTNVQTYTIPTVTETVTVTESTTTAPPPPPPPPPPVYPPSSLAVHRFWQGSDGANAFNFPVDSLRVDDFVAHAADSWATQGAPFKQYQPNGHMLVYQNFGTANDGISTVLTAATARANGWLAHHNGAEIPNPWNGNPNQPVVDLGKPGVAAAYVQALQTKLQANPWDGVFADDVNTWANLWSNGRSIDGYSSPQDWVTRAVLPLLQYVHANTPGELRPNLGDWPNQPSLNATLPYTTGADNEWFLTWNNAGVQYVAQIEAEYASMQQAFALGKVYQGIVHRTDAQGLKLAFCAAAIMGGDHASLLRITNQTAYGSQPMAWDAVLTTPLGAPDQPVSHNTGSVVWSRHFASGQTLTINTSTQSCTGI